MKKILDTINQSYSDLKYASKVKMLAGNCPGGILGTCNRKYGTWTFCSKNLNKNSIVYSFGVGTDISFDLEIIKNFGVNIFAFDPTPRSMDWLKKQQTPDKFKFYPWGIGDKNSQMAFYPPDDPTHVSYSVIPKDNNPKPIYADVFTLETIMKNLKHDHIDILKMDIEGAEYQVIDYLVENNFIISQLLVEFHDRFDHVDNDASKKSISKLENNGFKVFNISKSGQEVSFYNHNK